MPVARALQFVIIPYPFLLLILIPALVYAMRFINTSRIFFAPFRRWLAFGLLVSLSSPLWAEGVPEYRLPPKIAAREFVERFVLPKTFDPRIDEIIMPSGEVAVDRQFMYFPPELVRGGGRFAIEPAEYFFEETKFRFIPDETAADLGVEKFYIIVFDYSGGGEHECLEQALEIYDPIEGFNRVMFQFNNALLIWVFRPIGTVWATIFPREVIDHFNQMTENLEVVVRVGSCLCQARFEDAGMEFCRFLINTTIGVAGLFDPADYFWGIKERDEDFGQAFASWGIGPGCYIVLPIHGPTTARGAVGLIFDYGLDLKFYIPYAGYFTIINSSTKNWYEYKRTMQVSADPYELVKTFWYVIRQAKIEQ